MGQFPSITQDIAREIAGWLSDLEHARLASTSTEVRRLVLPTRDENYWREGICDLLVSDLEDKMFTGYNTEVVYKQFYHSILPTELAKMGYTEATLFTLRVCRHSTIIDTIANATTSGHMWTVKSILQVYTIDREEIDTIMNTAVMCDRLHIVKYLVEEHGVDAYTNRFGRPLWNAVEFGHTDVVEYLVPLVDESRIGKEYIERIKTAIASGHIGTVKALLENPLLTSVNIKYHVAESTLEAAVRKRVPELVTFILETFEPERDFLETLLTSHMHNMDNVTLFVFVSNLAPVPENLVPKLLVQASTRGLVNLVQFSLQQPSGITQNDLSQAFIEACKIRCWDIIVLLQYVGVDPCGNNNGAMYESVRLGNWDIVQYLLRWDYTRETLNSLLEIAVRQNHSEVIHILRKDPRI